MIDRTHSKPVLDHHLGCFGEFQREELICRRHCALRLRCAIESAHNMRMEILEEMVLTDGMNTKVQ
ncbi:MAG: hypothetical protein WBG37_02650 [Desulfobacterales bacterium]